MSLTFTRHNAVPHVVSITDAPVRANRILTRGIHVTAIIDQWLFRSCACVVYCDVRAYAGAVFVSRCRAVFVSRCRVVI